jgi:hypothetical protein
MKFVQNKLHRRMCCFGVKWSHGPPTKLPADSLALLNVDCGGSAGAFAHTEAVVGAAFLQAQ